MSGYPYREPYEEGFSDGKDEAKERIAELEAELAELREAAREVVDGKQRHSLKRRTVVNVHLMKLAELLEDTKCPDLTE